MGSLLIALRKAMACNNGIQKVQAIRNVDVLGPMIVVNNSQSQGLPLRREKSVYSGPGPKQDRFQIDWFQRNENIG